MTSESTQMSQQPATRTPGAAAVDLKLEVVIMPVSDVDRAKAFYQKLGWRLDADFSNGDWRAMQMTPPGSPCSIIFGRGVTTAVPGSVQGTFLIVSDIQAARADLVARGVAVSEVFHFDGPLHVDGTKGRVPGPDPEGGSYRSWAEFSDPDGNTFLLQEIKTRLPGRGLSNFDVPTLTELLKEAEDHHGQYEPTAPKHHWSDWYSAYIVARAGGKTPEDAAKEGALHMESLRR
jgi:catechol 2,3-dioxygenase-like lactoylglutathione lyase family enzyme